MIFYYHKHFVYNNCFVLKAPRWTFCTQPVISLFSWLPTISLFMNDAKTGIEKQFRAPRIFCWPRVPQTKKDRSHCVKESATVMVEMRETLLRPLPRKGEQEILYAIWRSVQGACVLCVCTLCASCWLEFSKKFSYDLVLSVIFNPYSVTIRRYYTVLFTKIAFMKRDITIVHA